MTREHKLSLIIGFVLILIVGVLISDHMSDQRRVQLASVAVDDERATLGISDAVNPVEAWVRENAAELAAAAQTDNVQEGDALQRHSGAPLTMEGSHVPVMSEPAVQTPVITEPEPVVIGNGVLASETAGNFERALTDAGAKIEPGPDGTPILHVSDTRKPEPAALRTESTAAENRPAMPEVDPKDIKIHRVQPKDSLYSIAKATYGDASLWTALATYNEGRVGKDGTVRVGATIKLPPKHVLTGGAPEPKRESPTTRQASKPQSESKASDQPAKKAESTKTPVKATAHTVVKGDSLSKLAERYLGSKSRASEIMALNKITDANQIRIGSVLKIPAK